mgnify:FL=1
MSNSFDIDPIERNKEFYFRFYSGGFRDIELGHEFLEFDIRHEPREKFAILRYANQTNYRNEDLIKKEVKVSILVLQEFIDIIRKSQILLESDRNWPKVTRESKQEIEIRYGKNKKLFKTKTIVSLSSIRNEEEKESLKIFYYLAQDLKTLVYSLISLHFKIKPFRLQ